jgi:hypothetical protein
MNAACGWTLIRKTSLLRKINPMMRRSSFTKKIIYNSRILQVLPYKRRERRNDLEIMNWIPQITLQTQNSDQSPLYDVRNPARTSCKGCDMRSDVSRTMFERQALEQEHLRSSIPSGGARRDRTDDLMLAKHALSQLSYGPVPEDECFTSIRADQLQTGKRTRSSGGPGKT